MNKLHLIISLFFFRALPLFSQSPNVDLHNQIVPQQHAAKGTNTVLTMIMDAGWIMIPLAALSFLTVVLVLVALFSLHRRSVVTGQYMHTAETLLKKGDFQSLISISNRQGSAVPQVMSHTLDFIQRNPGADLKTVQDVIETEGGQRAASWSQRVGYLSDIGAIAPMVGLLGTVVGMIQAFTVISGDVEGSRHMELAAAVSLALVATAGGLIIGIPALGAYAYFRGRVTKMIADLETACTELTALLAPHFGESAKTNIGKAVGSAPLPTKQRLEDPRKARSSGLFDDDF